MIKVVLASTSPRRKELLRRIVPVFDVVEPKEPEIEGKFSPREMALRLAVAKMDSADRVGGRLYVAADTVVEVDGRVMGKPLSEDEARRMLKTLSGRSHLVHTGVCVELNGERLCEVATTVVYFKRLEDEEVDFYVEVFRPLDKAGAYGIQDGAEMFVERIEGSYSNVVGLPLDTTYRLMRKLGFRPALWVRLGDIAKVVRSKNAGPFEVTFDVMFEDEETYRRFKEGGFLTPDRGAEIYGYDPKDIVVFEYFDQALALKITAKRKIPSGSLGDDDVYAAQKHVPLMNYLILWKVYG